MYYKVFRESGSYIILYNITRFEFLSSYLLLISISIAPDISNLSKINFNILDNVF